ncbi:MAG: M81 family metallopeptidase [Sterolibacterium sp.]|jgi:microcystin degradation protein MlrC
MRIYSACLLHESNSFSPLPTNLDSYREYFLYRPATGEGRQLFDSPRHDLALREAALGKGHQVIDGVYCSAVPSAPTNRRDYETLRDEMMGALRQAMPLDAVLLFLHGAQMAEGYDDCEGDVLRAARAIVGPNIPIGVLLDLHCNITPEMVDHADVIIACKEYPHTDFPECSENLLDLVTRLAARQIKPAMAFQPLPLLGFFHTTRQPMRGFVDRIKALEGRDGILSVSLAHGFPAGDMAHLGAGVLVVADGDQERARRLAEELGQQFFALRQEISALSVTAEEAVDLALAEAAGPVVIADVSDNPGGGATGDSTHILRALLDRKAGSAALASIWDPVALDLIRKAGVGGRLALRLGGKVGPLSGWPLDLDAEVVSVREQTFQNVLGESEDLGPTAAIRCAGIDIVVAEQRVQIFGPEVFSIHGIEPASRHILVVKSAQHFHAAFSPIARRIVYASPPGLIGNDFSHYPYRKAQRPLWPLDRTPFAAFGQRWE